MNFLLELASEEIPARMQAAAAGQLATRFADACKAAALPVEAVTADATPRRLWLTASVAAASAAASEERRGPKADAPAQAIEGFLRSTGLTRDQLEERDSPKGKFLYATIASEGRAAAAILAEAIPQIVRDFQWPKSMRWGAASRDATAPRWVRPLTGIVALLDGEVVSFAVHGQASGRVTRGHRIHAPGEISVASAESYAEQLRAAYVIASSAERRAIIEAGAAKLAADAGLTIIPDAGLVAENAGLAEWPVALLGHFDPAFLDVPREVIQLTMRTNQKYFALADAGGALAPAFVCIANLEASGGGTAVIKGNERVLSARLADAKFFWDQDVAAVKAGGLDVFLPKLETIVFHEKLGTMADKVERVAKLAEWLVESGAVPAPPPSSGRGPGGGSLAASVAADTTEEGTRPPAPSLKEGGGAMLAARAARLCKADLVSATVGEFPEVQGIAGAYLARLSGEHPAVADAIRDHYKPAGQGDEVPTAPVSVAVALADKLDTLCAFLAVGELPTGSRDPFAIRRAALSLIAIQILNDVRLSWQELLTFFSNLIARDIAIAEGRRTGSPTSDYVDDWYAWQLTGSPVLRDEAGRLFRANDQGGRTLYALEIERIFEWILSIAEVVREHLTAALPFLADRLKVQQRDAGVRPDVIDAVFALGGEDDLVRLLARVRALQAFIETPDGANLLAAYKRAANILKIEEGRDSAPPPSSGRGSGGGSRAASADGGSKEERTRPPAPSLKEGGGEEASLAAALDAAVPAIAAAVAAEDFTAAMAALAALRPPVDAFFDAVIVNAPDAAVRANRLNLLARLRAAAMSIADFSRIEG